MDKNPKKEAIQQILALTLKAQRAKLKQYKEAKRPQLEAPPPPAPKKEE